MPKTYWWRIGLIIFFVSVFLGAYIGPCDFNLGKCLGGNSILLIRTIVHYAISLLIVAPSLFFINDEIFKKWLYFAIMWFALATIFISMAPEYSGGYIGLNPTKESVSIWMGVLFVILSFLQIFWLSKKSHN